MRRTPASLAVLLLLAFTSMAVPKAHAQTCPLNSYSAGANDYYVEDSSPAPIWNFGPFNYDLVHGTFAGALQGFGEGGAFARIGLEDRYVIFGPPSGTPITIHARVRVVGTAGAGIVNLPYPGPMCIGSGGTYSLASGGLSQEVQVSSYSPGSCGPRAFDESLDLELTKLPGEEFPVRVGAYHSAGHLITISVAGTITFDGLPEGYEIRSCQGYAGIPVAAEPRSWGSIKGLYR